MSQETKALPPRGHVLWGLPTLRRGKWSPVLRHLALSLYSITDRVHLYPTDGVYTGMCLQKLGLIPKKHKGFQIFDIKKKNKNDICSYIDLMLVHSKKPQEMIDI